MVPLMVLWLLISIGVGSPGAEVRLAPASCGLGGRDSDQPAPWADFISNAAVAHWSLYRLGVITPERPIEVPGFLNDYDLDSKMPSLVYYFNNRGFEYVEIQYTTTVSSTPAEREGPGYYQFRLADLDSAGCAAMSPEHLPSNVWRYRGHGPCYEFQRTNEQVSRYAFSFTRVPLRWWPSVTTSCSRLTDLLEEHPVAQYCWAGYSSWILAARNQSYPIGNPKPIDILSFLQPLQRDSTDQNLPPE